MNDNHNKNKEVSIRTIQLNEQTDLEKIISQEKSIKIESFKLPDGTPLKFGIDYDNKNNQYVFYNYCGDIKVEYEYENKEDNSSSYDDCWIKLIPQEGWGDETTVPLMDFCVTEYKGKDEKAFEKDPYCFFDSDKDKKAYYMPKLFEQYVRVLIWKYLKKNNDQDTVIFSLYVPDNEPKTIKSAKNDNGIRYILEEKVKKVKTHIDGYIKPDIVLHDIENDEYIILDVKYKDSSRTDKNRDDRLQLLAYSYMYDAKKIGFIFPNIEEEKKQKICTINSNDKILYKEYYVQLPTKENEKSIIDMDFDL